jgi:hypothetical protein
VTIRRCWRKKKRRFSMIDVYEMAKENYPDPWNKAMIKRLVERGKLTPEQYEEITSEPYE